MIESRRSIFPKDYSGEKIEEEILNEILNSANFAPNHKKTKPWRFQVFRNEKKLELANKLAEIYKTKTRPEVFLEKKYLDIPNKISNTDTLITISVNFSGLVPEWEEIAATAMAVENMYLTCTVHQIGCYWSTPGMIQHLGEFLNLEENQKCIGLFYLGKIKTD
ncbi:MAG: nitroreductase [Flavobacteriales bacterium]|nr:nitroreductase [Flavobacteriales bacterium]